MGPGSAFPDDVNSADLKTATLIEHLRPSRPSQCAPKSGRETWSAAWAPDGSYFAWSCGNHLVKLLPWNPHKAKQYQAPNGEDDNCNHRKAITIDAGDLVWAVAFGSSTSSDSHGTCAVRGQGANGDEIRYHWLGAKDIILATGLNKGRIRTWDVETGTLLLELLDHKDVIRDLKFAPDGSMRLCSASRDGTLKVWDMRDDGNMGKTLRGNSKWFYALAWSPDATMLCSVGDSRSVLLWDMQSYKCKRKLEGHSNDVVACDFSPDGALLVTSSYDTRAIIWDPYRGVQLRALGHLFPMPSLLYAGGSNESYVRGVSFSCDGLHIASISDDTYVRFWNINEPYHPEQVANVANALCCSYSPDGSALAVGTRNGTVSLWLAPMQVGTLQHLCRVALRCAVPDPKDVDNLLLPQRLRDFVKYSELVTASLDK